MKNVSFLTDDFQKHILRHIRTPDIWGVLLIKFIPFSPKKNRIHR